MAPDLDHLQQELNRAMISWCHKNEREVRQLFADVFGRLPLGKDNGDRPPVGLSLLPIVVDPRNIRFARRAVSATLIGRFALFRAISKDADLRGFLTSGLSDVARELSLANSDLPEFFRGRTDIMMNLRGEPSCGVVEFNGEPLGEDLIAAAETIIGVIVGRLTACRVQGKPAVHPYDAAFDRFLAAYKKVRPRCDGRLPEKPNFGFFVNRDPLAQASYERLAFPAQDRLRRLEERYGISGRMFHTSDIEGFTEVRLDGKTKFLPRVGGLDLHIIRWLHDEPLEFETFWERLRATHGEVYYRLGGVADPVHNPTGGGALLAINGFSTFPTDKKFDAILGDPKLRARFQLQTRIEEVLGDEQTKCELDAPDDLTVDEVLRLLDVAMPMCWMLRRVGSGLYPESSAEDDYGLADEDLVQLIANRDQWVIKLSSLSCSGNGVFVGRAFEFEDLPADLVLLVSKQHRQQWDEILGGKNIATAARWLSDAAMDKLRDLLWPALVHHAVNKGSSIAQRAIGVRVVDGFIFRSGAAMPEGAEPLRFDYNFMSLGARTIHPLFRVTTAKDVTSIVGGQGGLAVSIHPSKAEEILRAVDS